MEQILENKLLIEIRKLQDQITALTTTKIEVHVQYGGVDGSRDLKDLFAALSKAQGEMEVALEDSENPYFKSKYANLKSVIKASRPYLSKNGLSILQPPVYLHDGQTILQTVLAHASGQWVDCRMRILPPKQDIQAIKSYMTYLKRICIESLIGVVTGSDDDDGEEAVRSNRIAAAKEEPNYKPSVESYATVTPEQLDELEYELKGWPSIAADMIEKMELQSLADCPKSKYHQALRRIRILKEELTKAGAGPKR